MNIPKEILENIDEIVLSKLQPDRRPLNESNSSEGVILTNASEIIPRPINWIWGWWLAVGKLHLIAGDTKTGKTTICLDLASRITNGGLFPDGTRAEIGKVLMWTGEDDLADTLIPRLMAMNADLANIEFITGYSDGQKERRFNPSTDLTKLESKLEVLKDLKDFKLLIIDPIVAVTTGDSYKNAETRKDLVPLVALAEKYKVAIIGITHFTKNNSSNDPIKWITGSLAYGALPRVLMLTGKTKDKDGNNTFIFARSGSNISESVGGFYYSLVKDEVSTEKLEKIETSKVEWGEYDDRSVKELFAQSTNDFNGGEFSKSGKLKNCEDWITDILSNGEMKSNDLFEEAEKEGFSKSTFDRAKSNLGIEPKRKGGVGNEGYWVVGLPKILKKPLRYSQKDMSTLDNNEVLREDSSIIEDEI